MNLSWKLRPLPHYARGGGGGLCFGSMFKFMFYAYSLILKKKPCHCLISDLRLLLFTDLSLLNVWTIWSWLYEKHRLRRCYWSHGNLNTHTDHLQQLGSEPVDLLLYTPHGGFSCRHVEVINPERETPSIMFSLLQCSFNTQIGLPFVPNASCVPALYLYTSCKPVLLFQQRHCRCI